MSISTQLSGLPLEILTEVLINLDPLSVVCSALKTTIHQSLQLSYLIELHRNGMIDTGNTKLSHQERLELLKSRQKAWARLDWKTASVVQLHGICNAYELVGGVFAHGNRRGAEFVTFNLPSSVSDGYQIRRRDIQIQPRDFAIDPGQDLVVFIEAPGHPISFDEAQVFWLHFHSLSTQGVHPRARLPVLPAVVPPSVTYGTFVRSVVLQIADDVVAVTLYTGRQQLVIYNWRAGFSITDSVTGDYDVHRKAEFAFISSRAYLLASPEGHGSIQIYSFESVEGYCPFHVATLHLPLMKAESRLQNLSVHTGPFETPARDVPFVTSPTSRIYVLTLSVLYDRSDDQSEIFYLFVKCGTFLRYLKTDTLETVSVPWTHWGLSETRLLSGLSSYSLLRYVHGQRVILPQENGSSDTLVIRVLDFNVLEGQTDADSSAICTAPTEIRHCFQETVVTRLPYSSRSCTLSQLSNEYSAFMIDEERIVAIKAVGFYDEQIEELHVFTF